MKKVIRDGVWETNSSSTHSICIHNQELKFPDYVFFGLEDLEQDGSYWYDNNYWATLQGRANYLHTIMCVCLNKTDYINLKNKLNTWLKEKNVKAEWQKFKWIPSGSSEPSKEWLYEVKDTCSDLIIKKIANDKDLFLKYLFGEHSQIIMGYDELYAENKKEAQKKYPEGKEFNYYVEEY